MALRCTARTLCLLLGLALPALPGEALAALVFFAFRGGSSPTTGTYGNVRTFTAGGISLDATARSRDSGTAWLGHYASGLGVTNRSESGGSPAHTVDNLGKDDFVRFTFSATVQPVSVLLTIYGSNGHISYNQGVPAGVTQHAHSNGATPRVQTLAFAGLGLDEVLRIYAKIGKESSAFKISGLTVELPDTVVPLPAALPLLASGLLGLGWWGRRASRQRSMIASAIS